MEQAYCLPPFTTPDVQLADDLYAVLAQRGLDGQWRFDYSRNPGITDDLAPRSVARALRPDYNRPQRFLRGCGHERMVG